MYSGVKERKESCVLFCFCLFWAPTFLLLERKRLRRAVGIRFNHDENLFQAYSTLGGIISSYSFNHSHPSHFFYVIVCVSPNLSSSLPISSPTWFLASTILLPLLQIWHLVTYIVYIVILFVQHIVRTALRPSPLSYHNITL